MDKQQLLEWIKGMPDDLQLHPMELTERTSQPSDWQLHPEYKTGIIGRLHTQEVKNELMLRLTFTTMYQGEFIRTYTDKHGSFHNITRVV